MSVIIINLLACCLSFIPPPSLPGSSFCNSFQVANTGCRATKQLSRINSKETVEENTSMLYEIPLGGKFIFT